MLCLWKTNGRSRGRLLFVSASRQCLVGNSHLAENDEKLRTPRMTMSKISLQRASPLRLIERPDLYSGTARAERERTKPVSYFFQLAKAFFRARTHSCPIVLAAIAQLGVASVAAKDESTLDLAAALAPHFPVFNLLHVAMTIVITALMVTS